MNDSTVNFSFAQNNEEIVINDDKGHLKNPYPVRVEDPY